MAEPKTYGAVCRVHGRHCPGHDAEELTNTQADKLNAELARVQSFREVANTIVDIVIAGVNGCGADEEDSKKILNIVIIRLQEARDS